MSILPVLMTCQNSFLLVSLAEATDKKGKALNKADMKTATRFSDKYE
jgi:hypothetical protein